jgi:uncharacterized protein YggE
MEPNRIAVACGIVLAAAMGAPGAADSECPLVNTVHTSGRATIEVAPDRVSFTAAVETNAPTVGPAVDQNNERMRAVIDALVRAGIDRKRIRTTQVSIFPDYDHSPGRQPKIVGYRVHNGVQVTVESVETVGKLLQTAIEAGANSVSDLSWSVSDPEVARARTAGLESAFDDAKAKASVLAARAGRPLGRALILAEGEAPRPPQPFYAVERMAAQDASVPTEPGLHKLTFTVSAVFDLD